MKRIAIISVILCILSLSIGLQAQSINMAQYEGKKIGAINISGLQFVTKEEILFLLPVKEGDTLSAYNVSQIISALYKTDYFKSISIDLALNDKGEVVITVTVVERPVVDSVEVQGNVKIGLDKIKEVVTIQQGDFLSPSKMKTTTEQLKELYLKEGYDLPSIEIKQVAEPDTNKVKIIIIITEAKRLIVKNIVIKGNSVVSTFDILNAMETKSQFVLIFEFNKGVYNEGTLDEDLNRIKKLYWAKGYLDADVTIKSRDIVETSDSIENLQLQVRQKSKYVNYEIFYYDPDLARRITGEKQMTIVIEITERKQYTYTGIKFTGNTLIDVMPIVKDKLQTPNTAYDRTNTETIVSMIREYYSNLGYVFNQIQYNETVNADALTVSVNVDIVENKRAHIEKIIVKGNTKTKDWVILRELMIKEGEVFNVDKLRQSIYNLYNTQYFANIDIQYQPGTEDTLVNLIIAVEEQNTGQFKFGMQYTPGSANSFALTAGITEPNFLGFGLQISGDLVISINDYKLTLSYLDKWFLGEPIQFGDYLSGEIKLYTGYIDKDHNGVIDTDTSNNLITSTYWKNTISFTQTFGQRWLPYFSLLGYLSLSAYNYTQDTVSSTPGDPGSWFYEPTGSSIAFQQFLNNNYAYWGWTNSLTIIAKYDTRDYYLLPTKGYFLKATLSYVGGILFGDSQYLRTSFGFNYNQLLFLGVVASVNTTLDFIFPQFFTGTLQLTPDEMLTISSSNEVRGLKLATSPLYGLTKGIFSFELQRDIVKGMLSGTAFIDMGYLLANISDLQTLSLQNFYGSIGFGIKLNLAQFPIRIYLTHDFYFNSSNQLVWVQPHFFDFDFTFTVGDLFTF